MRLKISGVKMSFFTALYCYAILIVVTNTVRLYGRCSPKTNSYACSRQTGL